MARISRPSLIISDRTANCIDAKSNSKSTMSRGDQLAEIPAYTRKSSKAPTYSLGRNERIALGRSKSAAKPDTAEKAKPPANAAIGQSNQTMQRTMIVKGENTDWNYTCCTPLPATPRPPRITSFATRSRQHPDRASLLGGPTRCCSAYHSTTPQRELPQRSDHAPPASHEDPVRRQAL